MSKQKKIRFVVELPQPDGWSKREVGNYIREAVTMWSKGGNPDDPIWSATDYATVKGTA